MNMKSCLKVVWSTIYAVYFETLRYARVPLINPLLPPPSLFFTLSPFPSITEMPESVTLPKKVNSAPTIPLLNPSTSSIIPPKRPQEGRLVITLIMSAHDRFDSATCFHGMIEGYSACVVMKHVR